MRFVCSSVLLSAVVALGSAQPPATGDGKEPIPPRYGVLGKPEVYPQKTAKRALLSALEAIEKGEYAYLVAHLLDPDFVDGRIADRAKQYEAEAELELTRRRDFQLKNRDKFRPEERLPTDREAFQALVDQQSREMAFKQLVRDVEVKLLNDPIALKELKKIARDGTFTDTETGAKATHEQVKHRAVFFRKIGDRWFVENRQEELPPKKEPGH